jgi:ParB family chromosome partitioning protein
MSKPALGRGLSALLGGGAVSAKPAPAPAPSAALGEHVRPVAIASVHPCAFQPRKDFAADALRELADSIQAQGILSPLIVRPRGDGFELIAGERRWRAAQLLGLKTVPIIVREADDRTVVELALIENLQRENLNPIEEAGGFDQLMRSFRVTVNEPAGVFPVMPLEMWISRVTTPLPCTSIITCRSRSISTCATPST